MDQLLFISLMYKNIQFMTTKWGFLLILASKVQYTLTTVYYSDKEKIAKMEFL